MNTFSEFIFGRNHEKGNSVAIVDRNGSRKTTRDGLFDMSRRVAVYVKKRGLAGVVPVVMDRSAETVAALLGFNLAGVGVAPLSEDIPSERLKLIEEQTGNKSFTAEDYAEAVKSDPSDFIYPNVDPEPAVVVFTSGSTGTPKGVEISNYGIRKTIVRCAERIARFTEDDVALQVASFAFALSLGDLFSPLYAGVPLHILPEAARKDAVLMTEYINRHGITKFFTVPKLLKLLGKMPTVRRVIAAGERLSDFAPDGYELINAYGLSETVNLAFFCCVGELSENTPIGKPDTDYGCYLVDENGNLSDEGEICISGAIASGYYKNPSLTSEIFTPNPFTDKPGHEKILHTGDIGRRLPDGNLLFLNRKDFMIKINGQRVEPGEAEAALKKINGVRDAAVVGFTEDGGRTYLCAFYESEQELDTDMCRSEMLKKLPNYMIPSFWVRLDKLPLNANGKTNRKALVPPKTSEIQSEYIAPVGETETLLCKAFEKVLNVNRVGAEDGFIRLGGDSIRAMEIVRFMSDHPLTADEVLSGKTPRGIARIIGAKQKSDVSLTRNTEGYAPLTDSQMGIYLQCAAYPDSIMYNTPLKITLDRGESMTADYVKNAVDSVIKIHEALYAFLKVEGNGIVMCKHTFPDEGICSVTEAENGLSAEDEERFIRPFDLFRGPMCRANALLTEKEVTVYIDCHHIVGDGKTLSLIVKQITNALDGRAPMVETVDAFSVYKAETALQTEEYLSSAKSYFESVFGGNETDSNLLFDKYPEVVDISADNAEITLTIPNAAGILRKNSLTESSLFMSAFAYALAKMTGQSESVFAVAENGRRLPETENTALMFVKTLPVLVSIDETRTAHELVKDCQEQFYRSVKYDGYSFGKIAADCGVKADVMFVYQSDSLSDFECSLGKVRVKKFKVNECFANLAVSVWKRGDSYTVSADYRSAYYGRQTIVRFLELLGTAVNSFIGNAVMKDIPLLSENDRAMLDSLNKTDSEFNANEAPTDMFERAAKARPDKIAVVCQNRRYTYREVDNITDKIAAYIHSIGIEKGQTVSVLIKRNEYIPIASIGILKAGAIYQPLDSSYPTERLAFMCKDADSVLLIADRELLSALPYYSGRVLCTDEIPSLPNESYECKHCADDGFVLLYTSGTTGLPKGCKILNRNVTAYIHAYNSICGMNETCVGTSYASYGFDAHMSEIYPPLTCGATLHIITEDIRLDFPLLKDYFEKNGITHTVMTTQIARQFVTEYPEVKHLRCILSGGEKLTSVPVLPKNYRLFNGYGPTEATVMITCFCVDGYYDDIPIGKSLPNLKFYITDGYGRRVPFGAPGELIAFGPQVSGGYINRPEKTAEVFISNIYENNPSPSYINGYKTGDIVRYSDGGNLRIIGRRDMQVKIRGFRIELSEVESVIREFPGVTDAVVTASDDPAGGKCICAYIVADEKISQEELNAFIKSKKPPYMVPKAIMQIESIPLTPNFKVDKRKLPPIDLSAFGNKNKESTRSLTELESSLCRILSSIIGHENFSVETNLSEAGLTSLTSIRFAVEIYKKYGVHITSKEISDGGTVLSVENSIVSALMHNSDADEQSKVIKAEYPLTQSQTGVYADSLSRGMSAYLIPFMVELDDGISVEKLKSAIRTAVNAHKSMLCTIYADENGEPKVHPDEEMSFEIGEETLESPTDVKPTDFEFGKSPLFRFRILHCGNKAFLFTEMHHIIADGESMSILMRDIKTALDGGALTEEKYTAFDLAVDEEKARKRGDYTSAKSYYESVFKGVSDDYLPPRDTSGNCAAATADLTVPVKADIIRKFCLENGISENIFFTGAFALTLARFTAHSDALLATVHNGRNDPRTENLVAMTVKTLPFYIETSDETEIKEYMRRVDDRMKMLKKYDLFSFADAAHAFGVSASIMFVYQGEILNDMPLGKAVSLPSETVGTKADISCEVMKKGGSFALHCDCNGGAYTPAWADGFCDAYAACISEILCRKTLGEVDICSEKAISGFGSFNNTAWDVKKQPVYKLIEASAKRHPDKIAVVASNGDITYNRLDNMTNSLAEKLGALGIPVGSTVAIMTGRTKEIYVAEVGILKAADTFLFLSPDYPDERISFIIGDSNTKAIVTVRDIADKKRDLLARLDLPLIYADDISVDIKAESPNLDISPDSLAYMIYTSGSTGKPKGVTVTQRGVVNLADSNPSNESVTRFVNDDSVSSAVTAFTFDASIIEGIISLAAGSTVCIAGDDEIHNPDLFTDFCLKNGISSVLGTPSFWLGLTDYEGFAKAAVNLKSIMAGGEEFTPVLLKRLYGLNPNLCIINGYGPSETTVMSSAKILSIDKPITVGTPLANTELYCLDKQNHILPMGALGELTVVGDGVGKGYLNRGDLTAKTFITVNGKPAFRTGDLAVITHGGEVEFHGRIDNQVKIRGLRVELGEIESAINGVPGIRSSAVIVKGADENKYLAAYYTAERIISQDEIIRKISEKLTKYMIPRVFRQLDKMPMTANGKTDRKALPDIIPEKKKSANADISQTEKLICELFGKTLSVDDVSTDDNFFEIGGNSIAASKVVMQLKSKGYPIEYQTIFDFQTPRALAEYLDEKTGKAEKSVSDLFDSDDPTDPSLHDVLKCNSPAYADRVERNPLGDVVLTGAVGFLGMHILYELLRSEKGKIYCLVRKGKFPSSEKRLDAISFYYFGKCLREIYDGRIRVIDADITSEDLIDIFKNIDFSTIINCAASVKHYASDSSIEYVNVHGVENMISLAKHKNARLIQISTTSVPGAHTEKSLKKGVVMKENQLFAADNMNNSYIISKYHAELCMLKAIKNGMKGKIIRVGNLMGRQSDGEFQINMGSNAFLNALKGFTVMGKFPVSHCTDPMEFSPVDCTAQAVVALAGTNDIFTVFHGNNRYGFDEMLLINTCNRCGLKIVPTDDKAYYEEFNRQLGNPDINKYLSALITNDRPDMRMVETDNRFTAEILFRLGFSWTPTEYSYLEKVVTQLSGIGFFDRSPQ